MACAAGRPIELLLGSEGGFVRSLVTDELAKGIDAAWRLTTDNALQDMRMRLSSVLQVEDYFTSSCTAFQELRISTNSSMSHLIMCKMECEADALVL